MTKDRAIQATNWEGETQSSPNYSEENFRVRETLTLPSLVEGSPHKEMTLFTAALTAKEGRLRGSTAKTKR